MKIPVYDFLVSPEREKQLAREYPVNDPEVLKDIEASRPHSLNIRVRLERKDNNVNENPGII